jgi:hypothetical protein
VGRYGELSQLDHGYLDENTTLVTLSVGGNDARFVDVFIRCLAIVSCKNSTLPGDTVPASIKTPERINGPVRQSIVSVLREIHRMAPNAKIMLMGYPRLMEDTLECDALIGAEDRDWITEMADLMAASMGNAVDQARAAMPGSQIAFANPISEFWGGYGMCGAHESIHRVVWQLTPGELAVQQGWVPEGWNGIGASYQSFHPTVSGSTLHARVMRQVVYDNWGL